MRDMSKTQVITARVDTETLVLVDKVAKSQGRSRAWFIAKAVQRAAETEADFMAFLQVGLDDIEAGRMVPHEDVVSMLDGMIEKHRVRCAK
jgi:predicted transcriptional regulator